MRSKRETDTFFKRFTAEGFYQVMNAMGAEVVFNHADYRLMSTRVLESFADFREVNIFLRGMVPLVGFPSAKVYYERAERIAGESHYPLRKMLALAFDGITSLSVKPIRMIAGLGAIVTSHQLYRRHLGDCAGHSRPFGCRLGIYYLYRLLCRRHSVDFPRCHRRIHRKNLYGIQAPSALYHQRAHLGTV